MRATLLGGLAPGRLGELNPLVDQGTDPAAGVEISVTVPGPGSWSLMAMVFTLVTSAAVANRGVALSIDNGTVEIGRFPAVANHTASLTVVYTAGAYLGAVGGTAVGGAVGLPLPPLVLEPGWRMRTITTNLQGADDFGRPAFYVYEVGIRGEPGPLVYEIERLHERLDALAVEAPEGVIF